MSRTTATARNTPAPTGATAVDGPASSHAAPVPSGAAPRTPRPRSGRADARAELLRLPAPSTVPGDVLAPPAALATTGALTRLVTSRGTRLPAGRRAAAAPGLPGSGPAGRPPRATGTLAAGGHQDLTDVELPGPSPAGPRFAARSLPFLRHAARLAATATSAPLPPHGDPSATPEGSSAP
ncbi:hypothetical protein [Streptomyces griseomycini]|uniref:Uncharacterized protein n=1 Tax=Streptomyces griseomycini TaxID=66895 RepID=A0A7W7VB48_9ACTN|nr:hypothetical protein [Streptomyces griseomycini]MBB4903748.1 hypothetical protein [Streptomyces griseomycini]GGQ40567.1 hypothetical protein GCM10010266_74340 [Streptomyces griseomycini]